MFASLSDSRVRADKGEFWSWWAHHVFPRGTELWKQSSQSVQWPFLYKVDRGLTCPPHQAHACLPFDKINIHPWAGTVPEMLVSFSLIPAPHGPYFQTTNNAAQLESWAGAVCWPGLLWWDCISSRCTVLKGGSWIVDNLFLTRCNGAPHNAVKWQELPLHGSRWNVTAVVAVRNTIAHCRKPECHLEGSEAIFPRILYECRFPPLLEAEMGSFYGTAMAQHSPVYR